MLPDAFSAARLIRMRVALAGSGAWRIRRVEGGGMRVVAILPGTDFSAKLSVTPDGLHIGELIYPDGRPLSTRLEMRDPMKFASLMHNVDCSIMDGRFRKVPAATLLLADAACASCDPAVQAAAESLHDDGSTLDLYTDDEVWNLPPESSVLVEVCRGSDDPDARAAAEALDTSTPGVAFDEHDSLRRWHSQVDRWLVSTHGKQSVMCDAGRGMKWLRLRTGPGVLAAAREIGRLEGEFVDRERNRRQIRDLMYRGIPIDDLRNPQKPGPHLLDDGERFFALMEGGAVMGLATVKDGDVEFHGPRGRKGASFVECAEAVVALRSALGIDESGPRL